MRGMCEAAGGVESANRRSRTKKATKMFIPVGQTGTLGASPGRARQCKGDNPLTSI